jgi:membrane protein
MVDSSKPRISGRLKATLSALRRRHRSLDHLAAAGQHYGRVFGNILAGAVTYYGFLSFFPLIALAFAVVGYLSVWFPDARESLVEAIQEIFPGIVTVDGAGGTISLQQIEDAKVTAGVIGFLGLLYAGLGWLSGMRHALSVSFELKVGERRSFIIGKAVDLGVMVLLGVVLLVSVSLTGTVRTWTKQLLDVVSLADSGLGTVLIWALTIALGMAANVLLFFIMYRLLGKPDLPARPLWEGALLAAIGFEALKLIVVNILGGVGGTSFAPLAIAVTLLLWINYFSRLVYFGASWAMTSALSARAIAGRMAVGLREGVDYAPAYRSMVLTRGAAVSKRERAIDRFDVGSAIVGGVAGAVAALFWASGRDSRR